MANEEAIFIIADDHRDVLNAFAATAVIEKNQVACFGLFDWNFQAFGALRCTARRHFDVKFFENVARETAAIETRARAAASVVIFGADVIFCPARNILT